MTFDIAHSPLALRSKTRAYRMPTDKAQTRYPSLRGQCGGKKICRFTTGHIRREQHLRSS